MDIEGAIYNILKDDPDVSALVADRIYPDELPENEEYPAVVFFEVSGFEDPLIATKIPRYQFNIWSYDRIECKSIKYAVHNALQRFKGVIEDIKIKNITLENSINQRKNEQTNLYKRVLDYQIVY